MSWVESTLGEVCDVGGGEVRTGPFGSQLHQSDYEEQGTPVVMPKDIIDGRVETESIARVGQSHVERLAQHQFRTGDIVYGRRGDIGRQALIRPENIGWLCGTGCLKISLGSNSPLDSTYLHLYLKREDVIGWIANQAIGATMPNLNTSILRSIPVYYPKDRLEQKRLARKITTYDDLIENNNRRIEILETIAQKLYQEWFIHYRYPNHQQAQWQDTDQGKIPVGWEVKASSEVIEFAPRMRLPKEGLKPFVSMPNVSTSSMVIDEIEWREGNSGTKFQNGDTLLARITPCLQNGKTAFVQFLDEEHPIGLGSTEFIVMRSKTLTPEFVYCLARSAPFRGHAINSMAGADGRQRVKNDCFDAYYLAVPPQKLLDDFSAIAEPLFKQVFALSKKNKNLKQQRDLLLPKLIKG